MPKIKTRIEKCAKCGKSVYANEKLEAIGKVFHNTCFRCTTCDKRLTMITYSEGPDKNPHCQTCYNKSFGPKGYGFGDTAIGEFDEHGKAVNTGLKSRSATYSGEPTKAPAPSTKPAWQVKQEKKVAASKAKKEQRAAAAADDAGEGEEQVPAPEQEGGDDNGGAEAGATGGGGGGGGGTGKTGAKPKKYAAWSAKPKPRKMKIGKRAIPKCARCKKSVYANEKIEAMGKDWHTTCFHCIECKKRVTPITFCEGGDDELYCKPCYGKFFAPRGHGFGGAVN